MLLPIPFWNIHTHFLWFIFDNNIISAMQTKEKTVTYDTLVSFECSGGPAGPSPTSVFPGPSKPDAVIAVQ
jgi:hypothetical protein